MAQAAAAVMELGPDHPAWIPLNYKAVLANTVEDIDRNIESALDRNLPPLQTVIGKESGAVAVVGSGPSLKRTWKRLLNFKGDILACNAAFQFLLGKGITPKYFMCFDADPLMLEFITPIYGVTYLMASRCPPKAFDMLEGMNVVCWHAAGDEHIREILERRKREEPMVVGGTAAVTRSMILAQPLGYDVIHIFGGDSSHQDGDTHIRQSTTVEKRLAVMVNKRIFQCSPWMAQQAEDFKVLAPVLMKNYGIRLHVHGDGLIPHIAAAMGCTTDQALLPQLWREWRWKAKALWKNL